MKKYLLTIATLFICAFSATLFAQNSSFLIGVHGGANFNKLKFTGDYLYQDSEESRKFGYQGGVDVGFKYNSFSLLTGLGYAKRGGIVTIERNANNPWIVDGIEDTGTFTEKNDYSVLTVPILLRYETKGNIAFTVSVGPMLNFGIGEITSTEEYDFATLSDIGPNEYTSQFGSSGDDLVKKMHTSFVFSPGVMMNIGDSGKLRANITFMSGGSMENENYAVRVDNQVFSLSGSIKSSAIAFEIGYEHRMNFSLGTKY